MASSIPTMSSLIAGLLLLSTSTTLGQVSISVNNPSATSTTPEPSPATPQPTPRPAPIIGSSSSSNSNTNNNNVAPPLYTINAVAEADTVVGIARADGQFSTLLSAMDAVGMSPGLTAAGPFTVLAPNNDAFATAPQAVSTWLQDPISWYPQLRDLLTYHVISNDELLSNELSQFPVGMEIYTTQGTSVTVTSTDPVLMIEDSTLAQTDILATNGVIHAINDNLLLPPSATDTIVDHLRDMPFFSTLVRHLDESNLLDKLQDEEGPFTLLAPTNEAFDRVSASQKAEWRANPNLLIDTLLFHVAQGNHLEQDFPADLRRASNDTDIVELQPILVGDILASNGVIHAVDRILVAPTTAAPTVAPLPTSIIGILRARGEFNMLLDALEETGRLEELIVNGPQNPFTIFAVPDAAFVAGLPVKFLNETWQTHLINVLTYHIVRGNLYTQNLTVVGQPLPTLNFNNLEVTSVGTNSGAPSVNNVGLTESNIVADNGIIHVVDQLILPPSATEYVMDLYALFPEFEALIEKVEDTNLTETLSTEGPLTVFSPVNGAIANVPLLYPDILTENNTEAWRDILLYHIVDGSLLEFAELAIQAEEAKQAAREEALRQQGLFEFEEILTANHSTAAPSSNVTRPTLTIEVPTLQGSNLTIEIDPNKVGTSQILFEDLLVKNGIVQVLDSVLIPPDFEQKFGVPPTGNVITTDDSASTASPTSEATSESMPILQAPTSSPSIGVVERTSPVDP